MARGGAAVGRGRQRATTGGGVGRRCREAAQQFTMRGRRAGGGAWEVGGRWVKGMVCRLGFGQQIWLFCTNLKLWKMCKLKDLL